MYIHIILHTEYCKKKKSASWTLDDDALRFEHGGRIPEKVDLARARRGNPISFTAGTGYRGERESRGREALRRRRRRRRREESSAAAVKVVRCDPPLPSSPARCD